VKGFQFGLERVLAWRQMQQTMAEAALGRLLGEQRRLNETRLALRQSRVTAQTAVARAPSTRGAEVDKLDTLRVWTDREEQRLWGRIRELEKAIAEQQLAVAGAARNVKMLDRLREKRLSEWTAEQDRQLESLTGEWAIGQWRRKQS
jgi:hypothetical protein